MVLNSRFNMLHIFFCLFFYPLCNRLTAYLEPNRLLEYFAYLGFTYYESGSLWPSVVNGDYNHYDSVMPTGNKQTNTNMSSLTSSSVIHKTSGLTGSQLLASHRSDLSKTSGSMTVANEALLRAIIITNDRRIDAIRRSTQRTVFYCRVYGARKVGKVSMIVSVFMFYTKLLE